MKVLVTGSRGNVGRTLTKYLLSKGHQVFGVGTTLYVSDDYRMVDINNSTELADVFDKFRPDMCCHLAAIVSRIASEASPSLTIRTNVAGTNNIIQLCRTFGVKLMYFSTSEVYGDVHGIHYEEQELFPNNIYGLSKVQGEQLVKYYLDYGLKAIIVRPFMLYQEGEGTGDHHSALIRFCDGLIKRQKITVHIGTSRSWMYIGDAVQVFESLLHVEGNHIVNVGNPDLYSISELADMICTKLQIDYNEFVEEVEMPSRTSLTKLPCLDRQKQLTGFDKFTSLSDGLDKALTRMLCR